MKKTTSITFPGLSVSAICRAASRLYAAPNPRGTFQRSPLTLIDVVIDVMSLVGYAPTREAVANWPMRKRVEAIVYAANVHARASDNPIQHHPELPWLRNIKPWCGPPAVRPEHIRADLWGAFAGPTPTEITT